MVGTLREKNGRPRDFYGVTLLCYSFHFLIFRRFDVLGGSEKHACAVAQATLWEY